MPFIAFLGCDGSGKSAVIQGLKTKLEQDGHRVTLGHWRPKALDASSDSSQSADDPHGKPKRGFVASVLKLGWLWLNWWIAWFRSLRAESRSGFVLFDRYHGDLLVDPSRYRYGGPMWLAKLVCRIMPRPDQVIFLDAPTEVLLARKQEVFEESLKTSRRKYLELCAINHYFMIVDACPSLEVVIKTIRDQLRSAKKSK
jgi:thymidylate kinase